jgi:AcrR family transcriptional regulator
MRAAGDLTTKGQRRAGQILEAALRCLARDGYAGTSLQRVADEAGLAKRSVIYYYGSRAGLFEHVVRYVGGQLLDRLEEAVAGLDEPSDIVERGFEVLWTAITNDRALLSAWFGLQAESITNPEFRGVARYISDRVEALIDELVRAQVARGGRPRLAPGSLSVLVFANVQGLILYYLDRGATPKLRAAIADFQRVLAGAIDPSSS